MSLEKVATLAVVACFSSSCVTTASRHAPLAIPVIFQPLFSACHPIDREASLRITRLGNNVFSSSVVWSFENGKKAEIQFNGPLGDTLLQVKRDGSVWTVSGAGDMRVGESPQGTLSIDGRDIPLKSDEIGCVLSGVWPSDWLSSLSVTEKGPASIELTGSDDLRRVDVDILLRNPSDGFHSSDIKSCAVLTWGGVLGLFKRVATICREQKANSVSMKLAGINDYIVEWVISDD
jgi:hypothetical protein